MAQSFANLDEQVAILDSYQSLHANCLPLPRTSKPSGTLDPCALTRSEILALEAENQECEGSIVHLSTQIFPDEAIKAMLHASGLRWEAVSPALDRVGRIYTHIYLLSSPRSFEDCIRPNTWLNSASSSPTRSTLDLLLSMMMRNGYYSNKRRSISYRPCYCKACNITLY
jgi:hypothetical protein